MTTEKKITKRFYLLDGTTAVLIANGYRWNCPQCGKANYAIAADPAVACTGCLSIWRVSEARHWYDQKALLPGTPPDRIYKPPVSSFDALEERPSIHAAVGAVNLTASGYSWRCPECDMVNFCPEITFAEVPCARCKARFEVSEGRHRTSASDLGLRVHPGAVWLSEEKKIKVEGNLGQQAPDAGDRQSFIG